MLNSTLLCSNLELSIHLRNANFIVGTSNDYNVQFVFYHVCSIRNSYCSYSTLYVGSCAKLSLVGGRPSWTSDCHKNLILSFVNIHQGIIHFKLNIHCSFNLRLSQSNCIFGSGCTVEYWIYTKIKNSY